MIYLDSCLIIYAVEDDGEAGTRIRQRLADHPNEVFVTSQIARLECLVGPLHTNDIPLHDDFEAFFEQITHVELTPRAVHRAADLRARHGLRTPDALHLALAQTGGCSALWTNDNRFAKAAGDFAVSAT